MPRIIFINRYFYPDQSATSQLLSDLAFCLAGRGHDVHVVTSRQRYDDPRSRLPKEETVKGVRVHRVASTQFGRPALIGRTIDYLSFYLSTWRALLALGRPGDIIVAKTDPPLLSILAAKAARRRQAWLINWLQDLYPEVAARLDVPLLGSRDVIVKQRDRSLIAASANVVPGESMAARVAARGVPADKIHVIPNWANDDEIVPIARADSELRVQWGLQDKFVVGYSGNLGRAHEFDTLLGAAEKLRGDPRIAFLCIGGGKQFDALAAQVEARGLWERFHLLPYQERAVLKHSLSVPDVHWMSLKPELEGLIFPSKLYGILAAGRPVIAVTAKGGEIARLVETNGCGIAVAPGNADALAKAIADLSNDHRRLEEMGRRARMLLDEKFSRQSALEKWRSLIDKIAREPRQIRQ